VGNPGAEILRGFTEKPCSASMTKDILGGVDLLEIIRMFPNSYPRITSLSERKTFLL
jgi:hypothetical protein